MKTVNYLLTTLLKLLEIGLKFKEDNMGMASSDDEEAIMKEYDLMETIKRRTPEYNYVTHNMNEDMKAIYDSSLKSEYLNPPVSTPSYNANVEVEVKPAR